MWWEDVRGVKSHVYTRTGSSSFQNKRGDSQSSRNTEKQNKLKKNSFTLLTVILVYGKFRCNIYNIRTYVYKRPYIYVFILNSLKSSVIKHVTQMKTFP